MNAASILGEGKSTKRAVAFTATCALAFACLIWVLHDIDYAEMWTNIRHMHWGWVAVAVVTDIAVYLFHGWRWSLLLRPLAAVPFWDSVKAIYVGLFANEVLPFRTGEIIRCYLIGRWSELPFSVAISSALIERIFDGVWLVACLVLAMQLVPLPGQMVSGGTTLGFVVLLGAVLLGAAMFWKEQTYAALSNHKWLKKVAVLLHDLHVIGHSKYLYFSAVASLPYLLMQVAPIYALARAYGVDISLAEAFVVMVVLRFSSVVPQAPGNAGLFNLAAVVALTAVGVESQTAKQFSVVLWSVITLPLLLAGFVALAATGINITHVRDQARSSLGGRRA